MSRPIGVQSLNGRGGHGIGRIARGGLASTRCGDGQIRLMLPLTGPRLTCPPLQRDGSDGRPIFVADDFAPCTSVGGADLRGTLAHTQQTLAPGSQASHGPPVLSTCGFRHTHNQENPRPTDPFPAGPLTGTNIERGAGSSKPSTKAKLGKVARKLSPFHPRSNRRWCSRQGFYRQPRLSATRPLGHCPETPSYCSIKQCRKNLNLEVRETIHSRNPGSM